MSAVKLMFINNINEFAQKTVYIYEAQSKFIFFEISVKDKYMRLILLYTAEIVQFLEL